jgi:hypothetical protein
LRISDFGFRNESQAFNPHSAICNPQSLWVDVAYGSDGDKHREEKPQETSLITAAIETLSSAGSFAGRTVGFVPSLSDSPDTKDE